MKHRALVAAGIVLFPLAAWTVSNDFNARMWLAKVPALPVSADTAYPQWIDNGQGALKPGEVFTTVEDGINQAAADQSMGNVPSQSQMQQQMANSQQLQQKYGTPEAQAAMRNMTPAQLMALAQQMQPQTAARVVSPDDQARLQKMNNGVYSGHQQVMTDAAAVVAEANKIEAQWDADGQAINTQEAAQRAKLPTCAGEASIPSDLTLRDFELEFADKRIALAGRYLPKFAPLVQKIQVTVMPEIDFGDDAMAAWSQIEDPGLKQQTAGAEQGAEAISLGDVGQVENLVKTVSLKAAQTVADKKAIQKKYADATGCR